MVGMFIDGSRYDENVLLSLGKEENPGSCVCIFSLVVLGFNKWAEYKEVWRKV
jgi:hypothetical protein